MSTAIETQDERDEQVAEAITSGRSLQAVRKEFGLSAAEIDAVLEKMWPIDLAARLRMIKRDVGRLDRLVQVFLEKALAGDVQSGLLTVRIFERLHELLGMNSAAKIEIVQAPVREPTRHEKIRDAIMRVARGPDWQPPDANDGDGAVTVLSDPDGDKPSN
jgi:hypothetical protein